MEPTIGVVDVVAVVELQLESVGGEGDSLGKFSGGERGRVICGEWGLVLWRGFSVGEVAVEAMRLEGDIAEGAVDACPWGDGGSDGEGMGRDRW